jgi:hypothetical protein
LIKKRKNEFQSPNEAESNVQRGKTEMPKGEFQKSKVQKESKEVKGF